jgi:hypothetical protein
VCKNLRLWDKIFIGNLKRRIIKKKKKNSKLRNSGIMRNQSSRKEHGESMTDVFPPRSV